MSKGRKRHTHSPETKEDPKITELLEIIRKQQKQIERLERLRDRLDSCIGCGCLSLQKCTLQNPDDYVSSRGPGAVYLDPSKD